ncbi:hypothetical protein NQZ79_g6897 [Umbelopsis isabellina]|nr:hypothetical protein NQZ79_g6897 [Umbelopsis isabellina]
MERFGFTLAMFSNRNTANTGIEPKQSRSNPEVNLIKWLSLKMTLSRVVPAMNCLNLPQTCDRRRFPLSDVGQQSKTTSATANSSLQRPMSEQEKLEKRRQRRQQKIMAGAGDRLSRITGTAYPDRLTPSPVPSPSTSTTSVKSLQNNDNSRVRASSPLEAATPPPRTSPDPNVRQLPRRGSHLDPDDSLGAPQAPFNNALANHFPAESPSDAAMQQEQMAALQRMFGGMFDGSGASPFGENAGSSQQQDPMSAFPFNPAMFSGMQPVETTVDQSLKYWTLAHFMTISLLGLYAVISEFRNVGSAHFTSLITGSEPDIPFTYGPAFVATFLVLCHFRAGPAIIIVYAWYYCFISAAAIFDRHSALFTIQLNMEMSSQ